MQPDGEPILYVVIPTVGGREEYLERCLRGYRERTNCLLQTIVIGDPPTCGLAWQLGADIAMNQYGAQPDDYLHFTADDLVPGEDWFDPMAEAVAQGTVPVAGVVNCTPEVLDEQSFPKPGNPYRPTHFNFFEGEPRDVPDWYQAENESEYPSVPFCSFAQWEEVCPMIASHYGTDRWFGLQAKRASIPNVVRRSAIFYHYTAQAGRIPSAPDWLHLDRLTFELNVAFPLYSSGELQPHETHPLAGTPEGRQLAREWYAQNVPPPWYWEVAGEPGAG